MRIISCKNVSAKVFVVMIDDFHCNYEENFITVLLIIHRIRRGEEFCDSINKRLIFRNSCNRKKNQFEGIRFKLNTFFIFLVNRRTMKLNKSKYL